MERVDRMSLLVMVGVGVGWGGVRGQTGNAQCTVISGSERCREWVGLVGWWGGGEGGGVGVPYASIQVLRRKYTRRRLLSRHISTRMPSVHTVIFYPLHF